MRENKVFEGEESRTLDGGVGRDDLRVLNSINVHILCDMLLLRIFTSSTDANKSLGFTI